MRAFVTFFALFCTCILTAQSGWTPRTNLPANGRHRASACAIGNKGYVGLGHVNGLSGTINYADWWEYDPASDSWTQKANYPTVNYGAVCFSAAGKAYIGGGAFLAGEFYAYSPLTNTWTAVANCPVGPGDQGAMSIGNKGYVISTNLLYEYDPATNLWTQKASAPVMFATWCVAFSTGSSGYVKSGTLLYEYKPLNNTWIQRASFPGMNTNGAAAVMHNSRAYIVSGYVGSLNTLTSEVWEYNPGNNMWTRIADFPGSARRFSVGFSIHDRGYFGTGTHGINLNDFWEMEEAVGMYETDVTRIAVVYPVPADDRVQIDISAAFHGEEFTVEVYSSSGELVREQQTENGRCTLLRDEMPAGVYLYRIVDGEKIYSGKFIFR